MYIVLRSWVHPAHYETLNVGDWTHIKLVFATFNETSQARGIQWDFGIAAIVKLQPGVLQASGCRWPPPEVFLKDYSNEISGSMAYVTEVLVREAEIHPAYIDASLLSALIQEGRDTTQHDVGEDS